MKDNMELDFNDDLDFSDDISDYGWVEIADCYEHLVDGIEEDGKYFSPTNQDDGNNLFKKVEECKYGCLLAAILQYGQFDEEFTLLNMPKWEFIAYKCEKIGKNPPEQFELKGEILDIPGGAGTQFATYNSRTHEFVYTHYTIRDANMFNGVRGKGKVPLTKQRLLDWEKHIPV